MSLLTLVQRTCDWISIPRPLQVVGSTDQQVRQLYSLANEEGYELSKSYDWQALTEEQVFITVADPVQTPAIPEDLDRFVYNSFFNRSTIRQMYGPITPQEWQAIKTLPASNPVYLVWRQRRGEFLVTMTPPAGQEIAYEYISKNWAKSSANQPKAEFTSDDDTSFLDERLMSQGLRWRFLRAKGLDYSEEMATYERTKQELQGKDGGKRILNLGGRNGPWGDVYLGANVQLGYFPG